MAMTEYASVYEQAASFERRQMRVLDGTAAKNRADAKRIDGVRLGLAVITILVYMLSLAFVSAKITSAGGEINAINAQITELENQAAIADLTIGAKSSLERVESYAIAELGMVYPDPDQTYFLSEDSSRSIAAGRQALAQAQAEQDAAGEQAQPGPLSGVMASVSGWLGGTAQAAGSGSKQ